jgi:hypothetical protein
MKELITSVCEATGLDEATATTAIGHVLLFMRDQAPKSNVAELIDKIPAAHQAVAAAAMTGDAGVTAAIGTLKGFFGFGETDMNILGGKLGNLGLSEEQMRALLKEVFAYAESLVGKEGVARMADAMPYLSRFMGKTTSAAAPRSGL